MEFFTSTERTNYIVDIIFGDIVNLCDNEIESCVRELIINYFKIEIVEKFNNLILNEVKDLQNLN